MSNMARMDTSNQHASKNMNSNADTTSKMGSAMAGSSNIIKNLTEYQTAQALVGKTQELFKYLKSSAGTTTTKSTGAADNAQIQKDIIKLKSSMVNMASFMDIVRIAHLQLHLILITTYHLLMVVR